MNRRTLSLIALLWVVVGTIHGLSRYSDIVRYELAVPFSIADIGYFILSYASWIAITVALLRVMRGRRFDFSPGQLLGVFVIGVVVWLPVYFAYDYGVSTLVSGGDWATWRQKFTDTSGSVVFFYAVVYALTFAVCGSVTLAARARSAESDKRALEQQRAETALALSEQQMRLMQFQLSPHFLFNCLSAISFLARNEDRKVLIDAVAKLGNLLRFTIENSSQSRIAISEELRFSEDYVGLQTLRFGSRFRFELSVDPNVVNDQCPPFSLQPLLENVFRHVIEQIPDSDDTRQSQRIQIRATVAARESRVFIVVSNHRAQLATSDASPAGHGTGIKNLEARLSHVYGSAYSIESAQTDREFRVELSFPRDVLVA